MKQREVQDGENVRWVCAQALAGVATGVATEAAAQLVSDAGTVPVVCTPSGGARTVRLELREGWETSLSDDELLAEIARERDA